MAKRKKHDKKEVGLNNPEKSLRGIYKKNSRNYDLEIQDGRITRETLDRLFEVYSKIKTKETKKTELKEIFAECSYKLAISVIVNAEDLATQKNKVLTKAKIDYGLKILRESEVAYKLLEKTEEADEVTSYIQWIPKQPEYQACEGLKMECIKEDSIKIEVDKTFEECKSTPGIYSTIKREDLGPFNSKK